MSDIRHAPARLPRPDCLECPVAFSLAPAVGRLAGSGHSRPETRGARGPQARRIRRLSCSPHTARAGSIPHVAGGTASTLASCLCVPRPCRRPSASSMRRHRRHRQPSGGPHSERSWLHKLEPQFRISSHLPPAVRPLLRLHQYPCYPRACLRPHCAPHSKPPTPCRASRRVSSVS